MIGLNPRRLIFREKERDRRKEEEGQKIRNKREKQIEKKERSPDVPVFWQRHRGVAMLHREITVKQP